VNKKKNKLKEALVNKEFMKLNSERGHHNFKDKEEDSENENSDLEEKKNPEFNIKALKE
jgi:hypothetical protein